MHPSITADLIAGWLVIALLCTGLGAYFTLSKRPHPRRLRVRPEPPRERSPPAS